MPQMRNSPILWFAAALGAAAGCAGSVGGSIDDSTPTAVTGSTTLVRAGSGKCLDVNGGGIADGTNIQQWTCNGTGAQSFRLDDLGNGQVRIVNTNSKKCVDIDGAGTADGTNIQLWTCNGTGAQSFVVEDQGGGRSRLRNPHSNKCVDVSGGSNADGANVQLWTCNGTSAQQWQLAGGGSGFVHPGVLVTKPLLDFVKAQIAASKDPWLEAYKQTSASSLASLSYTPHPVAVVECGPYSNPDIGCSDEKNDAAAAYTHALLWYLGGDAAHAKKAIAIMNAWSATLTGHSLSNAPLQSAWVGSIWPRAAEIIRYTYSGWSASEIAAFATMLENVYLPEVINGSSSNGNWELSMIEAAIGIGVFLDDQKTFDTAASMWTKRVPAYIYVASDGATPVQPPSGAKTPSALKSFWYNPTKYVEGLSQETCRDLGHVQYGFAAMINAAETARIQGVDLYATERTRIQTALEFHSQYLSGAQPNPTTICGVPLNAVTPDPMWEIAYNELANRDSLSLPNTEKLIRQIRPTRADHHMIWETLTHAEAGNVGLH